MNEGCYTLGVDPAKSKFTACLLDECVGDVPNVAFPCAAIHYPDSDELRVYYGGADTCVCLATTTLSELIGFIKDNDMGG